MDVAKELYKWARTLPEWQQEIVGRLLVDPCQTPEERADCIEKLLKMFDGKTVDYAPPLSPEDFPRERESGSAPRLLKLGGLRGVNAIDSSGELEFAPEGLTIIYGPTGAGKTGYVRALKRLCRTVDRDTKILPNVFTKTPAAAPEPRARVELLQEGKAVTSQWNLTATDPTPLATATVFDARCAHCYLVEENAVAFIPSGLAIFDRLVTEQMALRAEIDSRVAALEARRPSFPNFTRDTQVKHLLDAITAETDPNELRALATLSDEEQERLRQLRLVDASSGAEAEGRIKRLKNELFEADNLASDLETASGLLGEAALERITRLAADARAARQASRLAAGKAFAEEPLVGIGKDGWLVFWEAARSFWLSEDRGGRDFPPTKEGDLCPLCEQALDEQARERLARFEEWVKAATDERAQAAETALQDALRPLERGLLDCCGTPFVKGLEPRDADLYAALARWRSEAEARIDALQTLVRGEQTSIAELLDPPTEAVTALIGRTRAELETLEATHDPKKLEALKVELAELEDRERLATRVDDILGWIDALREIELLEKARSTLHTRAISVKQREFTEELMTSALREQLRRELDDLGLGHISVSLESHGQKGLTLVQLKLTQAPSAGLDVVLSDGEQRSLTLALCFAELVAGGNDAAMILDDPVTSVDHERRERIAARIVRETRARQAIVFTHDLPFLFYLGRAAEAEGVPCRIQSVWRVGNVIGKTDTDAPWEAMTSKKRIRWLKDKLQNLPRPEQAGSVDDYRQQVVAWYDRLRKTWERVVEEKLLAGVVQRWMPDVQTKKLKDIALTDERILRVEAAMTKASALVHDEPSAGHARLPSKQEMASDIEEIEGFVKELKSASASEAAQSAPVSSPV